MQQEQNYIDGIVYNNGAIDFIETESGRALLMGTSYHYEYNIRDNLGNVRFTFDKNPTTGTLRRMQEDEYYAFGLDNPVSPQRLPANKYLYNGKELQLDLQLYDYGARFYDPVIARWNHPDRLAERYYNSSPYAYGLNNPVKNIDLNGDTVLVNYNNTNIWYQNGKLYNKNGTVYSGDGTKFNRDGSVKGYKGFLGNAVKALSAIGKTDAGDNEINELQSSSNNFIVKDAQYNPHGAGKNEFIDSDHQGSYAGAIEASGNSYFKCGGSGGTIYYNPSGRDFGTLNEVGGQEFSPFSNLGHELFHGIDANRGLMTDETFMGLGVNEGRAVYFENTLRNQLGYPNRVTYDLRSGPVSVLDVNGNPVNFPTPPSP